MKLPSTATIMPSKPVSTMPKVLLQPNMAKPHTKSMRMKAITITPK